VLKADEGRLPELVPMSKIIQQAVPTLPTAEKIHSFSRLKRLERRSSRRTLERASTPTTGNES